MGAIKIGKTVCCVVVLFAILKLCVHFFALQSVNVIVISGDIHPQSAISVEYGNGLHDITPAKKIGAFIQPRKDGTGQEAIVYTSGALMQRFSIIVDSASNTRIDNVSLHSLFSNHPIVLDADAFNKQSAMDNSQQWVLNSASNIKFDNVFSSWILPLFLAGGICLLISRTRFKEFAAIKDTLSNQQHRNSTNLAPLDGIRGLAAILVLLHHSTGLFFHGGGIGVWLFFVLSGFLLSKPFVTQPQNSINIGNMAEYFRRRFLRIVPMYFTMIFVIFLIQNHIDTAFRHFLFLQGDGHYWTIVQEMYFYLLLPLIALLLYLVARRNHWLKILILLVLIALWVQPEINQLIRYQGQNQNMRLYFEVFAMGMLGSFLYYGVYLDNSKIQAFCQRNNLFISTLGLIALLFLFLASTKGGSLPEWLELNAYQQPVTTGMLCLIVIITAILNPQGFYSKLLAINAVRFVGVIGYSFYLVHPYAIFMVKYAIEEYLAVPFTALSHFWLASLSFILTCVIASFTYSYIERPFLKTQSDKTVS